MEKIKISESELKSLVKKVVVRELKESTDMDRYEDVVFLQGDSADEALEILDNQGEDAAMDYLIQWHEPGNHMGSAELNHGSSDNTYERDGYIMSYNIPLNYIGLQYELSGMNESKQKLYNMVENVVRKVMLEKQDNNNVIKEGIGTNIPKIEKYVNQINNLISQAFDSYGDPIGVIDPTSTWEEPYVYEPIIYKNGILKIVTYSLYKPTEKSVDVIKSGDMEYEGIPTLQLISRMYKKALKNKDKETVNTDI